MTMNCPIPKRNQVLATLSVDIEIVSMLMAVFFKKKKKIEISLRKYVEFLIESE